VGMFRRAEPCSWECFGVLNHDREDGTEVSYSIAAALANKTHDGDKPYLCCIAQSPCTPTRMCCRTPSTNGGSHSTVTLAAQSMASRAAAAAMASFIRAVALRLTAALSASGAPACFTAACCAAVLPLVLTTCGSKVQWHESRPLVYCMLPKALDPWSSFVSPSSS